MKYALLAIPRFLFWIFYFLFTLEERNRYINGKFKGMDCVNSYHSGILLGTTTYEFDPTRKPERRYTTWKEYWSKYKPKIDKK